MTRVPYLILCALLAALTALLCIGLAVAAPVTPGEVHHDGPSWWWGRFAAARVVGGEGGAHCADEGGACVVWAQGDWTLVEVDGQTVAARAWLPWVGR